MTRRIILVRTILVWLVAWPLVTGMLVLFEEMTSDLTLGLQTLILTAILVPLISLLLAPTMHKLATRWLEGRA